MREEQARRFRISELSCVISAVVSIVYNGREKDSNPKHVIF